MIGVEATKWIYSGIVCDWTAPNPSGAAAEPTVAATGVAAD
jgi:hypothetical protein